MYPLVEPRQRPERFLLNRFSPLAESAVFLGLGGFDAAGSVWYPDAMRLLGGVPNDGTLTNMDPATDWSRDLGRAVLDFDGSDDYALTPSFPIATTTSDYSVAGWVYVPTAANQYATLVGKSTTNFSLIGTFGDATRQVYYGAFGSYQFSTTTFPANGWAHVGLARLGGTLQFFVNGSASAGGSSSAVALSEEWNIGCRRSAGTIERFFSRYAADVVISRVAWSESIFSALADPSNVMLEVGGVPLILPPHRVSFPAAVAEPSGFKPYWLRRSTQIIGGGIAA